MSSKLSKVFFFLSLTFPGILVSTVGVEAHELHFKLNNEALAVAKKEGKNDEVTDSGTGERIKERWIQGQNTQALKIGEKGLRFLHLTDVHLDLHYEEGREVNCDEPPCCRGAGWRPHHLSSSLPSRTPSEAAGALGSYGCDSPKSLLSSALLHAARGLQPDFILLAGDTASSPRKPSWLERMQQVPTNPKAPNATGKEELATVEEERRHWSEGQKNVIASWEAAMEEVERILPGVPLYPALGESDMWPPGAEASDLQTPAHASDAWLSLAKSTRQVREALADLWRPRLGNSSSVATFVQGGYYETSLYPGLRLAVLNTELCHVGRLETLLMWPLSGLEQLRWLREVLALARRSKEKVLITGQMPPGLAGGCGGTWNKEYAALIGDFFDVVAGQTYGHVHSGSVRAFEVEVATDLEGSGASATITRSSRVLSIAHVSPALSPRDGNHPTFRVYEMDAALRSLTGFEQYSLDLSSAALTTRNQAAELILDAERAEWTATRVPQQTLADSGLLVGKPLSLLPLVGLLKANASLLMDFALRIGAAHEEDVWQKRWSSLSKKDHEEFSCGMFHVVDADLIACAGSSEERLIRTYTQRAVYLLTSLLHMDVILAKFGSILRET